MDSYGDKQFQIEFQSKQKQSINSLNDNLVQAFSHDGYKQMKSNQQNAIVQGPEVKKQKNYIEQKKQHCQIIFKNILLLFNQTMPYGCLMLPFLVQYSGYLLTLLYFTVFTIMTAFLSTEIHKVQVNLKYQTNIIQLCQMQEYPKSVVQFTRVMMALNNFLYSVLLLDGSGYCFQQIVRSIQNDSLCLSSYQFSSCQWYTDQTFFTILICISILYFTYTPNQSYKLTPISNMVLILCLFILLIVKISYNDENKQVLQMKPSNIVYSFSCLFDILVLFSSTSVATSNQDSVHNNGGTIMGKIFNLVIFYTFALLSLRVSQPSDDFQGYQFFSNETINIIPLNIMTFLFGVFSVFLLVQTLATMNLVIFDLFETLQNKSYKIIMNIVPIITLLIVFVFNFYIGYPALVLPWIGTTTQNYLTIILPSLICITNQKQSESLPLCQYIICLLFGLVMGFFSLLCMIHTDLYYTF